MNNKAFCRYIEEMFFRPVCMNCGTKCEFDGTDGIINGEYLKVKYSCAKCNADGESYLFVPTLSEKIKSMEIGAVQKIFFEDDSDLIWKIYCFKDERKDEQCE